MPDYIPEQQFNPAWLGSASPADISLSGIGSIKSATSYANDAYNQQQAAPFLANALQSQQSHVANQTMQDNEAMSPLWQKTREAQQAAAVAAAQGTVDQTPLDTQMKREQARSAASTANALIAENKDKELLARAAPQRRIEATAASGWDYVNQAKDATEKARRYAEVVDNLKKHPDMTPDGAKVLEQEFADPAKGMSHLQVMYNNNVRTAQVLSKMAEDANKENIAGSWKVKVAGIEAGASKYKADKASKDYEKLDEINLKQDAHKGSVPAMLELQRKYKEQGNKEMSSFWEKQAKDETDRRLAEKRAPAEVGTQFSRQVMGMDAGTPTADNPMGLKR